MNESLQDTVAWRLIERMLLIRRFEEAVLRLTAAKEFAGHYHLYIGQEATGAAAIETLGERDHLVTTHRNHGHVIARGADPGRAFAEILGRATGLNGGRGGTIHLCDPALGFLSTSGIVVGCISLASGGGYACKRRGDGSVTVAFSGDSALEEGVSFEAMNIASLWKLPVVFLCENNSPGSCRADVKRTGRDVTVVANSLMVHYALQAAQRLATEGIETEVVDLRTLMPLDAECILQSVEQTGRLVVVDEGPMCGGVATEISAVVAERGFRYLKAPILRVARADTPVPYSAPLEAYVTPDPDKIAAAVRRVLAVS